MKYTKTRTHGITFNTEYNAGLTEEQFTAEHKSNKTFSSFGEKEDEELKKAYAAVKKSKADQDELKAKRISAEELKKNPPAKIAAPAANVSEKKEKL